MSRKKKINKYPAGFRKLALERMKTCRNVSELSAELGIHRTQLYKWRRAMEADFFKGALQKVEARRQNSGDTGATASSNKSRS